MTGNGFFQSKWYHICVAAIYIAAGLVLIWKDDSEGQSFQPAMIGWILCSYGGYRIISRLLRKNSEKPE